MEYITTKALIMNIFHIKIQKISIKKFLYMDLIILSYGVYSYFKKLGLYKRENPLYT